MTYTTYIHILTIYIYIHTFIYIYISIQIQMILCLCQGEITFSGSSSLRCPWSNVSEMLVAWTGQDRHGGVIFWGSWTSRFGCLGHHLGPSNGGLHRPAYWEPRKHLTVSEHLLRTVFARSRGCKIVNAQLQAGQQQEFSAAHLLEHVTMSNPLRAGGGCLKNMLLLAGTARIHQDFDLHLNQIWEFDGVLRSRLILILIKNRSQGYSLRLWCAMTTCAIWTTFRRPPTRRERSRLGRKVRRRPAPKRCYTNEPRSGYFSHLFKLCGHYLGMGQNPGT